jgi:pimeloyl-ACP methyl ester carboxylesterase
MATAESVPTVLLVHGAWHGAWCWAAVQAALTDRGIPSLALDLPGHGASSLPLGDLYGDAAEVRRVIDGIGGPVVLVGHSYGGAVISEAAGDDAAGGAVSHLVYLTAFCVEVGEALGAVARSWPDHASLDAAIRPGAEGMLVLEPSAAAEALYGACTPNQVRTALALVGPQPMATFTQPVRCEPWRTVPSTYVVCAQDKAIAPSLQRHMAARCTNVVELDTDHSPFTSATGSVVKVLAGL